MMSRNVSLWMPTVYVYVACCRLYRVPTPPGKSWIFFGKISRPWKVLEILVESPGICPFLHGELVKVMKSIMERFIKPDVLSNARNLLSVDVTDDKNLCTYAMVDIGFSANKLLKELVSGKKVSDRQVMEFRMETRSFLQAVMKQLLLKSPLQYTLTKNLSALDPRKLANAADRETNKTRFRGVITKLTEAGRFPEADADEAMMQYIAFMDNVAVKCRAEFESFDTNVGRIDSLFYSHMTAASSSYTKLWVVVQQLLLLSHGQASVERGFSINRQVEADNIVGETVTARRIVCDSVRVLGGVTNVDVTNKKLLISCSAARQRYLTNLEDEKRKKETEASGRKRKALEDEVAHMKRQKVALEQDVHSLTTDADEFAIKAEKEHKVTLITKSNAMRRAAKEKSDQVKVVAEQLDSKLLELKNL